MKKLIDEENVFSRFRKMLIELPKMQTASLIGSFKENDEQSACIAYTLLTLTQKNIELEKEIIKMKSQIFALKDEVYKKSK